MMHIKGTPKTMHSKPKYKNVVVEILDFFSNQVKKAYDEGISDVIIDPGFGFGKSLNHNYETITNQICFSDIGLWYARCFIRLLYLICFTW